jgi:hypothetical protein
MVEDEAGSKLTSPGRQTNNEKKILDLNLIIYMKNLDLQGITSIRHITNFASIKVIVRKDKY